MCDDFVVITELQPCLKHLTSLDFPVWLFVCDGGDVTLTRCFPSLGCANILTLLLILHRDSRAYRWMLSWIYLLCVDKMLCKGFNSHFISNTFAAKEANDNAPGFLMVFREFSLFFFILTCNVRVCHTKAFICLSQSNNFFDLYILKSCIALHLQLSCKHLRILGQNNYNFLQAMVLWCILLPQF